MGYTYIPAVIFFLSVCRGEAAGSKIALAANTPLSNSCLQFIAICVAPRARSGLYPRVQHGQYVDSRERRGKKDGALCVQVVHTSARYLVKISQYLFTKQPVPPTSTAPIAPIICRILQYLVQCYSNHSTPLLSQFQYGQACFGSRLHVTEDTRVDYCRSSITPEPTLVVHFTCYSRHSRLLPQLVSATFKAWRPASLCQGKSTNPCSSRPLQTRPVTCACTAIYDGVISPTPGVVLQARLIDNQEDANTERCVARKLSRRDISNADIFGTDSIPNCGDIDHGKPAQGGAMHTFVYGIAVGVYGSYISQASRGVSHKARRVAPVLRDGYNKNSCDKRATDKYV